MEVSVRIARQEDIDDLLQCFEAAIDGIEPTTYNKHQKDAWIKKGFENHKKWLKRITDQYFLIAESNSLTAGFIAVSQEGYIDLLFTNPVFQRKGLAEKLYRKAEKYLLSKGVKQLETHASAVSRPFFEKNGFVLQHEEKFELFGVPLSNFLLYKQLD